MTGEILEELLDANEAETLSALDVYEDLLRSDANIIIQEDEPITVLKGVIMCCEDNIVQVRLEDNHSKEIFLADIIKDEFENLIRGNAQYEENNLIEWLFYPNRSEVLITQEQENNVDPSLLAYVQRRHKEVIALLCE